MPITDEDMLKIWLEASPDAHGDAQIIAARAALRVFPLWGRAMDKVWATDHELTALPIARLNLTSAVKSKYKSAEIKETAFRAAYAAYAVAARAAADSNASSADYIYAEAAACTAEAAGARNVAVEKAITTSANAVANANALYGPIWADAGACDAFWAEFDADARLIRKRQDLATTSLWHQRPPVWFAEVDTETRAIWAADPPGRWDFWIRWWDGILAGKPLDWDLQRDVALIPDADWQQGPDHIARLIKKFEEDHVRLKPSADPLGSDLRTLPASKEVEIVQVQRAIARNHEALPPTFDAIEGFIMLEIERLQSRNYQSDSEAEEARRMIGSLCYLHDAIQRLRTTVPADGPVTLPQAEQVEKLSRLYAAKLGSLPREKVGEVVEGIWATGKGIVQLGLIGTSSAMLMAFGLPALAGVAISTMILAPKLAPDAIKAAIEVAKAQAKP